MAGTKLKSVYHTILDQWPNGSGELVFGDLFEMFDG